MDREEQIQPVTLNEAADLELAAKIRPLPADVLPSQRFLQQMRARLLALKGPSQQAA